MTTRYQLPAGATSVSADNIHFPADENGHIDVTGAHPATVATLVRHAGITPVLSDEQIAQAEADEAERLRFQAAIAAMRAAQADGTAAKAAADVDAADATSQAERQAQEAETAARALAEAALAAAPVEIVSTDTVSDGVIDDGSETDARSVMPPRRKVKNG